MDPKRVEYIDDGEDDLMERLANVMRKTAKPAVSPKEDAALSERMERLLADIDTIDAELSDEDDETDDDAID